MIVAIILGVVGLFAALYALAAILKGVEIAQDRVKPKWDRFTDKHARLIGFLIIAIAGGAIGLAVYVVKH